MKDDLVERLRVAAYNAAAGDAHCDMLSDYEADVIVRGILASIEAEGYVVVPREPTEESVARMMAHALKVNLGGDYNWHDYMTDLYRLAAAPKPK